MKKYYTIKYSFLLITIFIAIFTTTKAQNLNFYKQIVSPGEIVLYSIDTVHDKGYITGGWEYGANGGNYFILKTDSNGNEMWRHLANYFTSSDSSNLIRSIHETRNHDFIMCGELKTLNPDNINHILMARIDSIGDLIWLKLITEGDFARARNILELDNGDIVITGTYRDTTVGIFIGKFNSSGDSVWTKKINYPHHKTNAYNLINYNDKLIVVGLVIDSTSTKSWPNLIEIDTTGIILNNQQFEDTANLIPINIYRCNDTKLNLTCTRAFSSGGAITENYKLDSSFNKLDSSYAPYLTACAFLNDSVFIGSQEGIRILSFSFDGDTLWSYYISEEFGSLLFLNTFNNSEIIGSGKIDDGNSTISKGFILKFDSAVTSSILENHQKRYENIIFPNPASDLISIAIPEKYFIDSSWRLSFYNIQGELILRDSLYENNKTIDIKKLHSGIYTYSIKNTHYEFIGKIIIN